MVHGPVEIGVTVRLKRDDVRHGPAEAGHYVLLKDRQPGWLATATTAYHEVTKFTKIGIAKKRLRVHRVFVVNGP